MQLNAYEPLAALAVMESQHVLLKGSVALRSKCVDGISCQAQGATHFFHTRLQLQMIEGTSVSPRASVGAPQT